jgi:hypothetical protein
MKKGAFLKTPFYVTPKKAPDSRFFSDIKHTV